jgi:hypothetical protein
MLIFLGFFARLLHCISDAFAFLFGFSRKFRQASPRNGCHAATVAIGKGAKRSDHG